MDTSLPGKVITPKAMPTITKLLKASQTNCAAGPNAQPEWTVIFEADGRVYAIERYMAWTTPELHQVQAEAGRHPDYFWNSWVIPALFE